MELRLTATGIYGIYAIWDHSVTCHPTQVNTPQLNVSQMGRYSIYLSCRYGRLCDLDIIMYMTWQFASGFKHQLHSHVLWEYLPHVCFTTVHCHDIFESFLHGLAVNFLGAQVLELKDVSIWHNLAVDYVCVCINCLAVWFNVLRRKTVNILTVLVLQSFLFCCCWHVAQAVETSSKRPLEFTGMWLCDVRSHSYQVCIVLWALNNDWLFWFCDRYVKWTSEKVAVQCRDGADGTDGKGTNGISQPCSV